MDRDTSQFDEKITNGQGEKQANLMKRSRTDRDTSQFDEENHEWTERETSQFEEITSQKTEKQAN